MNKVVLLGSTGMIGSEVLKLCLSDSNIHKVVSISRNKTGIEHEKLKEIIHSDFLDFSNLSDELRDVSSLFFCIGVYTGAVDKEKFKVITYDFTVAISKAILEQSPNVNFMFLSGAGADKTESSRSAFAKYKGMAENFLMGLGFKGLTIFRPGYIYPVVKRKEPNLMYSVSRSIYPLLKLMGPKYSIKSTELAQAMFLASTNLPAKIILENLDILNFLKSKRIA